MPQGESTESKPKRDHKLVIDILMAIFLPLLMAYSLIGETFHEAAGTCVFILFLAHLRMHRKWWKAAARGTYSPYRCFVTALNAVLLALMFLQPLSGIATSHHLYVFLPLTGVAATARQIHLVLAYWSFVLVSIHLGLHVDWLARRFIKRPAASWPITVPLVLTAFYGITAFIRRGFPEYMTMRTMFAFFDFDEPLVFFIADYLAVMALFAAAGFYAGKLLKTMSGKTAFAE